MNVYSCNICGTKFPKDWDYENVVDVAALQARVKELEEWEVRWSKRQKRLEQENDKLRKVADAALKLIKTLDDASTMPEITALENLEDALEELDAISCVLDGAKRKEPMDNSCGCLQRWCRECN